MSTKEICDLAFALLTAIDLIGGLITLLIAMIKIKTLDYYFYSDAPETLKKFNAFGWSISHMRAGEYGLVFLVNWLSRRKIDYYYSKNNPISKAPRAAIIYYTYGIEIAVMPILIVYYYVFL